MGVGGSKNYFEMFQCVCYAVIIDTCRDIVGYGLHTLIGIAHSHSDARMAQHTDVVSPIAECHCLVQANAEMPDYFVNATLFGVSFGGDIHECRMPASQFAVGDSRQYGLLLFAIYKRCQLVIFFV